MIKWDTPIDLNQPNRIMSIVLWGTTVVIVLLTLLLCHSYLSGNTYEAPRIGVAGLVLLYVAAVWVIFKRGHYLVPAWMVIGLHTLLATLVAFFWGVNTAAGMLLFGFVLVLTGALVGSRYIVPAMLVVIVILGLIQVATDMDVANVDASIFVRDSTWADVAGYAVLLAVFALVAWLSGQRLEQSLDRALAAESGLAREKNLLSVRLEKKTREVREAQLEEIRQLYQFAEIGQLGTVLLHDLANSLTALTLDIDDIGAQMQRNESITRAKESIAYLETIVNGVRRQIHERDKPMVFDATEAMSETMSLLDIKARRAAVTIEYAPEYHGIFPTKGDPVRFTHILTILVSNAIEAYGEAHAKAPIIAVTMRNVKNTLVIRVTDHANGMSNKEREKLFTPFSSTKPDGMGIGLYMAREMTEHHFHGTLTLDSALTETTFILTLPRALK